ncbi:TonB-dependent receptor [Aquimarina longa]|uniref:TonB-dependent receptor n=1 Tax=Aquimarina longa TaxID=1080221 RepID=UPI0007831D0D|nr:TonB-dependent receptor [Aquimarina longa]
MKNTFTLIALLFVSVIFAQETGTIAGKLLDKESNNQPLPFANVLVKGSTKGSSTDFDGLYEISGIAPGTYTLEFSFTGYQTVEVPNVVVEADKVAVVNATMGATAAALEEVVIKVITSREREEALLLEQKNAIEIKQSIGAQELARKGVSDAEGAVTKVAGITKAEGVKNVFVRGLGDRLNSTTLNGLPLPSEDPLYKNISLDFFSSDIIQSVGVNKAFGSNIYGDVAGANIDVVSKEHIGKRKIKIDISTGINTLTVGKKNFLTVNGANSLGTKIDNTIPTENFNVYNFDTSFKPDSQDLQTNGSISISYGNSFNIKEDNKLSTFLLASFENDYSYKKGDIFRITTEKTKFSKDVKNETYTYNVKQILLGNLKYKFGANNTISYNGMVIHNNSQNVSEQFGVSGNEQGDNESIFIRRQQQNSNKLFVNQLLSKINLTEKIYLDLGGSYNIVRGDEPDRRIDSYTFNPDTKIYLFDPNGQANTQRFYGDLKEDEYAAKFIAGYKFGNQEEEEESNLGEIKVGYNYRNTDRDFENITFGFVPLSINQRTDINPNNIDNILNQGAIRNEQFEFRTNRGRSNAITDFEPYTYNGNKEIHSGFFDGTYTFSPKFTANVGVRADKVDQSIIWDTNISSSDDPSNRGLGKIEDTYFLPSLNLKYSLNENNIFRLAASQTYTLPQFKELAPFKYEGVDFSDIGNPNMIAADNYNIDLKWERYFKAGEIISVTGFYKNIQNPINKFEDTVGNLTFDNTGDEANIYGIELELRKKLVNFDSPKSSNELFLGFNASFLEAKQNLKKSLNFTNTTDDLEGASPVLINTDLTYTTTGEKVKTTSSLVFSYFSERVFSLGVQGNQNTFESAIPTLDFVSKIGLGKKTTIKFSAKNLLDPTYKLTKETVSGEKVTVTSFKKGLNISIGMSYAF